MNQRHNFKVIPIILSGGEGTRLWPLSRKNLTKPYLKLYNSWSLLQNTVLRVLNIDFFETPIIVSSIQNKFITLSQLKEIKADHLINLFEVSNHNTAPSVAVAAEYVRNRYDENALLLILPVDHIIEDIDLFIKSIQSGIDDAIKNKTILFGVKPLYASTQYGYIKVQKPETNDGLYYVERFSEKPKHSLAERYLSEGDYFWNSGIYLASAKKLINDFKQYQPLLFSICEQAVLKGKQAFNIMELSVDFFESCPSISIDYAITEYAADLMMAILQSDWQDIGDWNALYDLDQKDQNDNVIHGNVMTFDTTHSYARAENDKFILMIGVKDCIAIETRDAILIANKDSLSKFKIALETMKEEDRNELATGSTVFKPWGSYTVLETSPNFQVKKLVIQPDQAISLQEHQYRSEHWVIIKGKATVTLGHQISVVHPNESIFVPIGMRHRIANHENAPLEIIEIQIGSYLGEDDIKRYEDMYVREAEVNI